MTALKTETGMTEAWKEYALHLREVLTQCGVPVSPCLPGESLDCGSDYAHHCMSYLAALKAKADSGLRHMHHGDPAGERMAEGLYATWSDRFEEDSDCGGCTLSR